MSLFLSDSQLDRFRRTGVIAVMVVDDPDRAVRLAKALLDGGVDIMELTLRTAQALDCLSAIVKNVPEMLAGAGTILFPEQVEQVVKAGAAFGVAPGTNPVVIRRADQLNLRLLPVSLPDRYRCRCAGGLPIAEVFSCRTPRWPEHAGQY
ncbi:MAG: hypothetical protein WKF77_18805 [Planctomycetaceae bacterium]